mgnify:CR=1 FL=1
MALTALSIDIMLPALPQIGEFFALAEANDRQLVVTSYMIGFAAGQLVFGPLSDRLGRKTMLMAGLAIFIAGSLAAVAVEDFTYLLLARSVQGFGAASSRVISIAVIRDLFSGWEMARVTSLVMIVFITVPMMAPSLGQGLLYLGDWTLIFNFLLAVGLAAVIWSAFRLPETHPEAEARTPIGLTTALGWILTTPQTLGYVVAIGFVFGCLMAYISSAQQIFVEVYGLGTSFPLVFGAVAGVQAVAAFTNAQLVQRHGMRRVSHTALVAFCTSSLLLMGVSPLEPPLLVFAMLLASVFFSFGLIMPNFNAIAMQPMGAVAGTASSFIGFYTTGAGAIFGWAIGAYYDGTIRPLATGFAVLSPRLSASRAGRASSAVSSLGQNLDRSSQFLKLPQWPPSLRPRVSSDQG